MSSGTQQSTNLFVLRNDLSSFLYFLSKHPLVLGPCHTFLHLPQVDCLTLIPLGCLGCLFLVVLVIIAVQHVTAFIVSGV